MKVQKTSTAKFNNNLKKAAIGAGFLLPAIYITKLHTDMYGKNNTKNRNKMRNKMIGFFAGVGVSVIAAHKRICKNKDANIAAKIAIAATAPIIGLIVAKAINKQQYQSKG